MKTESILLIKEPERSEWQLKWMNISYKPFKGHKPN